MVKRKKFKKEYGQHLLSIAEGDLDAARVLLRGQTKRKENIFYMAEQAVEKALKAVICHLEIEVPLTHSISALLFTLPNTLHTPFGDELDELTEFATIRRYESGHVELTDQEAKAVIEVADRVLTWASGIIAIARQGNP